MINYEVEEIRKHVEAIVDILGIEKTESNENTPLRVAKMYCNELFANRNNHNIEELNSRMKLFPVEGTAQMPITVKDIPFTSVCEHHWLPFFGSVDVSYIPNEKIIGLSKIPRVIKYFSKKPQLQERLTNEIGEYLVLLLAPKYLEVSITAKHTCVMCRGAESPCETATKFVFKENETMGVKAIEVKN